MNYRVAGQTKVHDYDFEKSFKQGKATWIPAACGTRTCIGWFPHAKIESSIDCKRCLARRERKKNARQQGKAASA